jgi:putative aldouronate transport system substrate-binding protein
MKQWNKTIAVLLTAVLVIIMAAACSGKAQNGQSGQTKTPTDKSEGTNAPEPSSEQAGEQTSETNSFQISKEPLTLSIHLMEGTVMFNDEWPVFAKAAELTNIKLKGTIPKSVSNSDEVFNLMMASGELADIVKTSKEQFEKYGVEGAFLPLEDLIREHAPNISRYLQERDDFRKIATAADGHMYYVPFIPDGEAATGWFIRQDWLDALNLPVPKTVDEYYNVLKAFRDGDPNGNGKADEIPFFHRSPAFGVYFLLSLWDADKDFYVEDGKIVYGPLQPSYKIGMANLAKWYEEGLIDKEIFTRGSKARDILLADNIGGSTHDWFGSTAGYNTTLADKVPGIRFMPIAPPASISGKVAEYDYRDTVRSVGWGISAANKHPVETIKYFDFWFSEEGRRLMNFGIDGETYTMVDGKPQFTEELLSSANVVATLKEQYGAQIEIGFHQDFEYEKQWENPIAAAGADEYIKNGYIVKRRIPVMNLTVEEQKRITELKGPIETYRIETGQKWVLGAESVEDGYDKFVEQLKSMKVDELLDLYNQAYARYLAQ